MTKDEYGDFVLRYKGCGACFPMYHTLNRFEKMWFTAIQKDVAELEKENEVLKGRIEGFEKQILGLLYKYESVYKRFPDLKDAMNKAESILKENAELKAQIEKMKCCENCRYCNEWGEANSNSPNCKKCNWVSNWKLRR